MPDSSSFRPRASSSRQASPEPPGRDIVRAIALAQEKGQAGVTAQDRGDYETAIIYYTSAISLRPESRSLVITLLINRATSLYALGQKGMIKAFNSSLTDVKAVLRLDPKHYKALGLRGTLHMARLEFSTAAYCFRCAAESASSDQRKQEMLAEAEAAGILANSTREDESTIQQPLTSSSTSLKSRSQSASPRHSRTSTSRNTLSSSNRSQSRSESSDRSRSESRGRPRERIATSSINSSRSRQRPICDYYALLGLPRSANMDQIKTARRKALLLYHPDRPCGDSEKYAQVSDASDILLDEQAKLQYDLDLLL